MGLFWKKKSNDFKALNDEVQALRWDVIELSKSTKRMAEQNGRLVDVVEKQRKAILMLTDVDKKMSIDGSETMNELKRLLETLAEIFRENVTDEGANSERESLKAEES